MGAESDRDVAGEMRAMADLAVPMALRVAATLRIADHIASGRTTAAAIAGEADVDADGPTLDRLLRYLAAHGVLDRDESGRHSLTARGEALRSSHPSRLRERLDIDGALGRAELSLVQLLHSVRTGEPAFPAQYGQGFWDDLAEDRARSAGFDVEMAVDVARWAPEILAAHDWGRLGHLVDVGGGNGTLLLAFLAKYPDLRGTVLDLPATADAARREFAATGLGDRATAFGGSFFDPLPAGADGYMLTAVIHNWADEPARAILRRCAEAARAQDAGTGRVFVVEKIGADGRTPNPDVDLRLLAWQGGRERSLDELVSLCGDAGLALVAHHPAGSITILELAPSG